MPSKEPLEMMIETFSIASLMLVSPRRLDAAARLGDAADLRRQLRGAVREQLVELLDRDPRGLAEAADRRRGARLQERVAHEPHHLPMALGQLADAVGRSDLLRHCLVPPRGVHEEPLLVHLHAFARDARACHVRPPDACAAGTGPAGRNCELIPGMSWPGSSTCQ